MNDVNELQEQLAIALEKKAEYIKFNQIEYFDPYPYQIEFLADPSSQKALRAGNQQGKTFCACALDAMHLTGRYPVWFNEDWWKENMPKDWDITIPKGSFEKYEHPVNLVVGCINNDKTRDIIQKSLFGDPINWEEELGTAWIPKDCIGKIQKKRGVPDAFYNVRIKHHNSEGKFNGWSRVTFLAYEMGKETWMGHKADINHMDEEPPVDILEQGGRSGIATGGKIHLSFTPENGATDVVKIVQNDWSMHTAEWKDVSGETYDIAIETDKGEEIIHFDTIHTLKGKKGHLTEAKVRNAIRYFRPHTIRMRMKGIPVMGTGLVFHHAEDKISCDAFEFPEHFRYLDAIDHGGLSSTSHPTAWARLAHDPMRDIIYVYDGFKVVGKEVPETAAYIVMRPNTSIIPTVWPHDLQKGADGDTTADQYEAAGVSMYVNEDNPSKSWATHPPRENEKEGDGGNRVLPAIEEMSIRMNDGRLQIFNTVGDFFEEYRNYHMQDGKIVDIDDDFLSACFHPDTEVLTEKGPQKISEIDAQYIITIDGSLAEYKNLGVTRTNAETVIVEFEDGYSVNCTPDHRFLTNKGWVRADNLEGKLCYNAVSNSRDIKWKGYQSQKSGLTAGFIRNSVITTGSQSRFYTGTSGGSTMGKYLLDAIFTMLTAIRGIMILPILSVSMVGSTSLPTKKGMTDTRTGFSNRKRFGGNRQKEKLICQPWAKRTLISCVSRLQKFANNAGINLQLLKTEEIGFAQTNASLLGVERQAWTTNPDHAKYANHHSPQTNIHRQKLAAENVVGYCLVSSVKAGSKSDVYCLNVPKHEAFAIKNGVVVHNCRYGVMMIRHAVTLEEKTIVFNQNYDLGSWMGA